MKPKTGAQQALYFCSMLLFAFSGCKLDKPDFAAFRSGGSTPTGGVTNSTDTYQPATKGSYWKYNYSLNGIADTTTTTLTGNITMLNGRKYYEGISVSTSPSFPSDTGYLSRDNHIYTNFSSSGGVTVELYYLNDTTAVGHGWMVPINSTGYVLGTPGRFVGKIIEKNISKTVNGKTYTHVIHSQVALQYDYGSGFATETTYDNYAAKNIGLIEIDFNGASAAGAETIIGYSIK